MATQTMTFKTDDLDGTQEGEGTPIETIEFALDGTTYEIDLHGGNAQAFRNALAQFVQAARKATGFAKATATKTRTGGTAGAKADREQNQAIRQWAKSRGALVNDRGRIVADIVNAYNLGGEAAEQALRDYIDGQRAAIAAEQPNGQTAVPGATEQVPAAV